VLNVATYKLSSTISIAVGNSPPNAVVNISCAKELNDMI